MTVPDYVARPYPPVHNAPAPSAQWQGMSEDQVKALRQRLIASLIQVVVQAVTGLFVPRGNLGDALEQLREWAEGLADGNFRTEWEEFLEDLRTGAHPINVESLFGQLPEWLLGNVPLSSIVDIRPNLLVNPLFSGVDPVADNPDWTQDTTIGYGQSDSVTVTADGTLKALRSDPIQVNGGQRLHLSIKVMWDGFSSAANTFPLTFPFTFGGSASNTFPLTFPFTFGEQISSGDPIRLEAVEFVDGVEVGSTVIASIPVPTQSSTEHPDSHQGWVELTEFYTAELGVDEMMMRLVVDNSATTGTVSFSDARRTKVGRLQLDWTEGLPDLFSRIFTAFGGGGAWIEKLENFLANLKTWLDHRGQFDLSIDPGDFDPRDLIPQNLQDVIDNIFDGFHNDGVRTTEGNPISSILDSIFNTKGIGTNAQYTGNTANSGVARIEARLAAEDSSGTYLFDGFDYPNAAFLPATYTRTVSGSGSYGPNGNGEVTWTGGGGVVLYRRNDASLVSDNGEVHVVVTERAHTGLLISNPDLYLIGRANAAFTTRIQAKLSANATFVFQAVVGGSTIDLSPNVNLAITRGLLLRDGDHIIYRFGTSVVSRRHVLIVNDETIYEYNEGGTTSQIGASFRYCGFGGHAEAPLIVYEPPSLAAWVMSDQAT